MFEPLHPNTHEGSSIALFMQVPLIIDEFLVRIERHKQ